MSRPQLPADERPRSRKRDFWQLDVPLVLSLVLCSTFTVIEAMRATQGVWRSWIYMFEWPMIGAFCIWMWIRFKREPGGGFARRWRERAAQYGAEGQPGGDRSVDGDLGQAPAQDQADDQADDPELAAWRRYQRGLRMQDHAAQPDTPADPAPGR